MIKNDVVLLELSRVDYFLSLNYGLRTYSAHIIVDRES
jgi:hypothetical protein